MKPIASDNDLKEYVDTFNRMNAMTDRVKKVDETIFLHLQEPRQ